MEVMASGGQYTTSRSAGGGVIEHEPIRTRRGGREREGGPNGAWKGGWGGGEMEMRRRSTEGRRRTPRRAEEGLGQLAEGRRPEDGWRGRGSSEREGEAARGGQGRAAEQGQWGQQGEGWARDGCCR